MIFYVEVVVSHQRPLKLDEFRRYAIEADHPDEADLIACQMAACTSVMPISSEVVGDEEFPDYDDSEVWS